MLSALRSIGTRITAPLVQMLARSGINPDLITWLGSLASVLVALSLIPLGFMWQAALILAVTTSLDFVDGQLARITGRTTPWGGFLDSVLDRVVDSAIFLGLIIFFVQSDDQLSIVLTASALIVNFLVPYIRARAELGTSKTGRQGTISGGPGSRTSRLILIFAGLVGSGVGYPIVLSVALILVIILGLITCIIRFGQARSALREP